MNIVLFDREELAAPLPAGDRRAKHITDILKLSVGDRFRAGIVNGPAGAAVLRARGTDGSLDIDFEPGDDPAPAGAPGGPPGRDQTSGGLIPLGLLLGHPRPIVLRRMLRDLSTLGVERIVVARTELGEKSYLRSKLWEGEVVRGLLIEGAEQAGVSAIPEVARAWSLSRGIEQLVAWHGEAARIMFDAAGEAGTAAEAGATGEPRGGSSDAAGLRGGSPDTRIIAVGPERGWTEAERQTLQAAGFARRSLGARILRTETAAVAAVVVMLQEMGLV